MSEGLVYIWIAKKSNGNKRKKLLGKNEKIRLKKKWQNQGHIGFTMPITITSADVNPILHCVFGDNGLLQCRIGLISAE